MRLALIRHPLRTLKEPLTAGWWRRLVAAIPVFWAALRRTLRHLCREHRLPPRPGRGDCCADFPPSVYKRADPLIYAQHYLMKMGLPVTWDNPDITVLDAGGVAVAGPLAPATDYRVRVRIWNGSYDAPAVGLRVELSYLAFGAQTASHPIAKGSVNLGVKGTAQCPAFLTLPWTTPEEGGHYCLQARLLWADDANPDNNLGQKNVTVAETRSPAQFAFAVGNQAAVPRRFEFVADAYALPPPEDCENPCTAQRYPKRRTESEARWRAALARHGPLAAGVPEDWAVRFSPETLLLDPRDEASVKVEIEPLDPAFAGTQPFNVHVYAVEPRSGHRSLVGGVTLAVTRGEPPPP